MKDILKTLVEIPSVSGDHAANSQAIEYIDRFLSERGMYVKRLEFNGFESVVATTRKTKRPRVLLAAHADVVPAPEAQFVFREEGGRYSGRGVFDMKFAIAAYLQLVDELNGSLADYDFGIMVTTDEELGGANGTKQLVAQGYGADVVILPDVGDTPNAWKLERSAKGRLALEIQTTGKSTHGSRPWKGENAIDKLMAALQDIHKLFEGQGQTTNTMAICTIQGGEAFNQIPASASAGLDVRTLSNEDGAALRRQIGAICEQHGARLVEHLDAHCSACRLDKNHPLVRQFISCATQVIPKEQLVEADSTGGSDARFFADAGIPCIVVGPPGDGCHMDTEWVSEQGLQQLLDILRRYIQDVAKPHVDSSGIPV